MNLVFRNAVSLVERSSKSTISRALKAIEQYAQGPVDPESVLIRSAFLCNDQPDLYDTQFTREALAQINDAIAGLPVMRNHNTFGSSDLPVGRWLFGEPAKREMRGLDGKSVDANWSLCTFFLPRAGDTEGLIPRMEMGVVSEVSFSWYSTPFVCSICERELSHPKCEHQIGSIYDGEKCIGMMTGIDEGVEASLVWKGGQIGTSIVEPRRYPDAERVEAVVRVLKSKGVPFAGRERETISEVEAVLAAKHEPTEVERLLAGN